MKATEAAALANLQANNEDESQKELDQVLANIKTHAEWGDFTTILGSFASLNNAIGRRVVKVLKELGYKISVVNLDDGHTQTRASWYPSEK